MKRFDRAYIPDDAIRKTIEELVERWERGELRDQFPAADLSAARACITSKITAEFLGEEVYMNDRYQVNVRRMPHQEAGRPDLVHLSIKRRDKAPIHDWRDLQEIKNAIVGSECEAVELYPAESRRVDSANQYHLWCSNDPTFRFGFGFNERLVCDAPIAGAVNRPFTK